MIMGRFKLGVKRERNSRLWDSNGASGHHGKAGDGTAGLVKKRWGERSAGEGDFVDRWHGRGREQEFSPTAWGEMSWQKRALKRMRMSGKVTQARNCRGRLGCIW